MTNDNGSIFDILSLLNLTTVSKASLSLSLCTIGCLYASTTQAQVTSDGTVNTQVNQNGNVAEITGGETRGGNLFHSFQDFSVPTNNEAFFNNADSIANIFSRVTGGNVSNIDGLIRANGSASLFLINPNGIVFGEGARLDIGGSFFGSTASSILFEDGEFSAVNNLEQPILTVNAPIGLGFRDNPGDIVNRSVAGDVVEVLEFVGPDVEEAGVNNIIEIPVGLQVKSGKNISLIGGDVKLENGNINAPGGKVEIGGLEETGIVSISNDGSLNFPDNIARSNVSLINTQQQDNGSIINVAGDGGGFIKVHAKNLELSGRSLFLAGIKIDSNIPNARSGDIDIDTTDNIFLNMSRINNLVPPEVEGNSGNINIKTKNLDLTTSKDSSSNLDVARINASTLGKGNAGNITIEASEQISLDAGVNLSGRIQTAVEEGAIGNAGDINITTGSLLMSGRNAIRANTFGKGNAGNITINASDRVSLQGEFISNQARFSTGILSQERPGAEGNSGEIIINTPLLSLSDYSIISTSSRSGQGGDTRITVKDLFLRNTSGITAGGSIGGNLFIDARFIVSFPEQSENIIDFPNNAILANANRGNGGNISITAEGIFGIEEREREPGVNFISASSDLGIDGTVSIDTPQVDAIQTDSELPTNLIESEQNIVQACKANREIAAQGSFTIKGKGGIVPEPILPLDALNVYTDGEAETEAAVPEALETSQGKIQPARGIRVTQEGIVLTAYRTNNQGDRLPANNSSCDRSGRANH